MATSGVEARVGAQGFRTEIVARGHRLVADEPRVLGGTDAGPTPYEYVAAALASCTAITLRMYADRRGWPLADVVVRVSHRRAHEDDCARCEEEEVGLDRLERSLTLEGPLTDEQRERLHLIAERCPVGQTLARGLRIVAAEDS